MFVAVRIRSNQPEMYVVAYYFEPTFDKREFGVWKLISGPKLIPEHIIRYVQRQGKAEVFSRTPT